jgi:hypothetical protein
MKTRTSLKPYLKFKKKIGKNCLSWSEHEANINSGVRFFKNKKWNTIGNKLYLQKISDFVL